MSSAQVAVPSARSCGEQHCPSSMEVLCSCSAAAARSIKRVKVHTSCSLTTGQGSKVPFSPNPTNCGADSSVIAEQVCSLQLSKYAELQVGASVLAETSTPR